MWAGLIMFVLLCCMTLVWCFRQSGGQPCTRWSSTSDTERSAEGAKRLRYLIPFEPRPIPMPCPGNSALGMHAPYHRSAPCGGARACARLRKPKHTLRPRSAVWRARAPVCLRFAAAASAARRGARR
jgi:hypothetical protein